MVAEGPTADEITALEYDLVDSGTAFLARSVKTIHEESDTHSMAFAIADLATAVEVLMKARLLRNDWKQLCIRPDTSSFEDLKAGTVMTIRPHDAIECLDALADVDMTVHKAAIKRFARLRNRAIHLTLTNQGQQPVGVQAEYGRALDFVLSFLGREFRGVEVGRDITVIVEEVIEVLTTMVGEIRALVDARMETLSDELASTAARLTCPRCHQAAFVLQCDRASRCAFCLWSPDDGRLAAKEYVDLVLGRSEYESAQDGEPYAIDYCPECSVKAHVEGLEPVTQPDPGLPSRMHGDAVLPVYWGCFSCGATATATDLDHCSRCGTLTDSTTSRGVSICSNCFATLISSN